MIFSVKATTITASYKCNFAYRDNHSFKIFTQVPLYFFTVDEKSRNKTGKVKTTYSHDVVRIDADVNIDLAGPLINVSGVAAYQGWLAGYKTAFDTQKSKVTANNFALGYTTKDFVLHTNV